MFQLILLAKIASTTFTQEFQTSVASEKIFKSIIEDPPNTLPKAIPQVVKSIEPDPDAGAIRKITLAHGAQVKLKIDAIDTKNKVCKFTLIEGEILGNKIESISHEVKCETSSNGGSIVKVKGAFRPKAGYDCSAEIKADKAKAMSMFKDLEGYLLANPRA